MPVADKTIEALLEDAVALRRNGALADAAGRYRQVLQSDPQHVDALYYLAQFSCQQGDVAGGVDLVRRALAVDPRHGRSHNLLGMALSALDSPQDALASFDAAIRFQPELASAHGSRGDVLVMLGRLGEAVESYDRALTINPALIEPWCNRGAALQKLGRHEEALASYERALAIRPNDVEAFLAKGAALRALNRNEEALACYDKACAVDPRLVAALVNRGLTLRDLGRRTDALASYDAALSLDPNDQQTLNHRGVALSELGRHEDALKSYERAMGADPNDADVHFNRGNALYGLNRYQEALASFDRALALSPAYVEALTNRGSVLFKLRRAEEALASYDAAIALKPDHADANIGRGTVLFDRGRVAEALACFDQVLVRRPDHVMALNNRSLALMKLGRRAQAIATQEQALAVEPNNGHAYSSLLFAHLAACDWAKLDDLTLDLDARLNEGGAVLEPFAVLEYSGDPRQQLRSAQNYARARFQSTPHVVRRAVSRSEGPIRLAYLSGDFRPHPVAHAIAELIERHDRSRFEVIGISYGPDDGSDIRARIKRAFNQFHDVSATSDRDAAELMSGLGVDIAVDLAGYTENARPGILAHRPAPVQANYLGYSGTTGADFIDYVIADEVALPLSEQQYFSEKIVHLPDCFLVNEGPERTISDRPSRGQAGLPERGFVFCSFNNSWKIRREVFDVWVRLLRKVEGSVLWLALTDDVAMDNLRRETAARGIDPARLVFAPKVPRLADHLARHRVADLFLDTVPYNAHSTASDALWTGLPVLTCSGRTLTGRIAASVLTSVGLSELVTHGLEEYEAVALKLATDPSGLKTIRSKLEQNRHKGPLFDTQRFRRHIEAAYTTMCERSRRGEGPGSFSIDPIGLGEG